MAILHPLPGSDIPINLPGCPESIGRLTIKPAIRKHS